MFTPRQSAYLGLLSLLSKMRVASVKKVAVPFHALLAGVDPYANRDFCAPLAVVNASKEYVVPCRYSDPDRMPAWS